MISDIANQGQNSERQGNPTMYSRDPQSQTCSNSEQLNHCDDVHAFVVSATAHLNITCLRRKLKLLNRFQVPLFAPQLAPTDAMDPEPAEITARLINAVRDSRPLAGAPGSEGGRETKEEESEETRCASWGCASWRGGCAHWGSTPWARTQSSGRIRAMRLGHSCSRRM